MLPNLINKRFAIFGLQGSGKTYLARYILATEPRHMVYDVLNEYKGFNRYIVSNRQYELESLTELNLFVNKIVINSGKIRLFIMDEANRYCQPKPRPLPDAVLQLNDFQRHYNIAFGVIARRPTQLHSDLVELAHYLFIFNLAGKNDRDYLNDVAPELGDKAVALNNHKFLIVDQQRQITEHDAIR